MWQLWCIVKSGRFNYDAYAKLESLNLSAAILWCFTADMLRYANLDLWPVTLTFDPEYW